MFLGVSIQREKSVQRRPLPNVISMRLQQPIGYCGLRKNFCRLKCLCAYIWDVLQVFLAKLQLPKHSWFIWVVPAVAKVFGTRAK
jgi:hypothetical protein